MPFARALYRPLWICVVLAGSAWAQTAPPPASSFDVASIKPAKPDARGYSIRPFPGRLEAENVTLQQLIAEAYHVYDFQVSGPKWTTSDRYDLEAKTGGGLPATRTQLRELLQKLLADRFALRVRRESKEMPVYALEAAKPGARLERAKNPDAPMAFRVFQRRQITAENAPLEPLTVTLTWVLGKPVLDRTGLTGSFDYRLEWAPDEVQVQSQEAPPDVSGNAPSLSAALQSQLGLKLISKKDAVDMIVVETAERPAAN